MSVEVSAPGRVNLIGEHTDYNEGFVMPAAIDLRLALTAEKSGDRLVRAVAEGFGPEQSFSLDDLTAVEGDAIWLDYIKGVCAVLEQRGKSIGGASLSISSAIPVGAGLSSSAALELAVAGAFNALYNLGLTPVEMAEICREAENSYVGVRCGIMDQFAVALGRPGQALLLDCRSLHRRYIPFKLESERLLIIDTRVERTLSASAYNKRREECEEALMILNDFTGRAHAALRDLTLQQVEEARRRLPDVLYRRARFVVEENARVEEAALALQKGDLPAFGLLMQQSHLGLRDLYEVSCLELNLAVDTTMSIPGVFGARMTGAGFGGCAIALMKAEALTMVARKIAGAFAAERLTKPHFYDTSAASGLTVRHT